MSLMLSTVTLVQPAKCADHEEELTIVMPSTHTFSQCENAIGEPFPRSMLELSKMP